MERLCEMLDLRTLKSGPFHARQTAGIPRRIYIQLGRTGDAIASVPLCWLYWKETGQKCALMVAKPFASFLEGISYIHPEIWTGDFKDIPAAREHAKKLGYKEIKVAQIYGHGITVPHTQSSFILESWKQVGRLNDFGAPLVFDRRNYAREAELAKQLPTGKPLILVAADGHSAPFPNRDKLFAILNHKFGDVANVFDLGKIRHPHYHDFLGLIDRAACLVTCDTAFGQLACASQTPVCALIAYLPGLWYSSPRRANHVCYIRYNEFDAKLPEFLKAVGDCLTVSKRPTINHVWSCTDLTGEPLRRHETAKATWEREARTYGKWRSIRFTDEMMPRSAQGIGEAVKLPYIQDMLDCAAKDGADEDIVVISNADINFVPGLAIDISRQCQLHGAAYCHRWDFPRVNTPVSREQVVAGRWYVGCDLFACTIAWWKAHKAELPPFILGRECWDWVFRKLIDQHGGVQIEQGIYHEKHPSPWELNRNLPGNLYNRGYARAWLEQHGIDLAEITNEPHAKVQWPLLP